MSCIDRASFLPELATEMIFVNIIAATPVSCALRVARAIATEGNAFRTLVLRRLRATLAEPVTVDPRRI